MVQSFEQFRDRFITPSAEEATQFNRELGALPAEELKRPRCNCWALFSLCYPGSEEEGMLLSSEFEDRKLFAKFAASRKITPVECALLQDKQSLRSNRFDHCRRIVAAIDVNRQLARSLWHLFSSMQQNGKSPPCLYHYVDESGHLTREQKDEFHQLCPLVRGEPPHPDDAFGDAVIDHLGRFIELVPIIEELKKNASFNGVLIRELEEQVKPLLQKTAELAERALRDPGA